MRTVVRLLCLASIVLGGVKAKSLENIKREILQVGTFVILWLLFVRSLPGQTYGYNYLPLLLSLSAPPLSVLIPNPLPPNAPASIVDSKYPYATLRKSLRLLIEDPDHMEELENDISYVYSGYAPISVRLVQCVAQKGGVLSNPAGEKEKKGSDGDSSRKAAASAMVQAHPIVGWKGFEDVTAAIPGETVDIVQRLPGSSQDGSALPPVSSLSEFG